MFRKNHSKTENDFMQELISKFSETRDDGPIRMIDVASWAYRHKKWLPQKRQVVKDLAQRLSRAAKRKHHIDPQGRNVRSMHAAKYPKMDENGQLIFETMWDYAEVMSAEHARISFTQRWHHIEGACRSLKRDTGSFNDNNPRAAGNEIQLSFNFEYDLEIPSAQVMEAISEDSIMTLDQGNSE